MKVLITGSSGIGKSTIIKALGKRGFTAYDTDDVSGATRLENRATGEPVAWPKGYIDWSTNGYVWNWQPAKLKKLLASDETVFVGAITSNQADFYPLFDYIITLTVDLQTLRRRLETRTRHGFHPKNIEKMLIRYPKREAELVALGAIPVNNTGSTEETVEAILKVVTP